MGDFILPSKEIALELSSYCGANCVCCPHEDFPLKNRNMDYDLFVKCVDDAVSHGAISIDICLMGDALLDPGIEKKLGYCREKYPDLKIYCSSTAQAAKPEFAARYIDTLQISIYGATKDVYEAVHRGGLKFEKTVANIEGILALPEDKRPYVTMVFLLLPENQHQVEEWKTTWEPRVDEILIWRPHNWAGRYAADTLPREKYGSAKSCCRPFGGDLCVWVNGDVTVCCFSEDKRLMIGNMYEQTLEEIFYGDKMKRIQEIHKNNAFYGCGLPCEKCDQIFPRTDALVYSSKDRKVGQKLSHADHVYKFEG
uniref:Radical SAM domain protein n=1 Tax=uncultured bacterium contig00009 TaxID=1181501 RepID=A0A806KIC7_9BACT|nr:radical SAM domain protein [uncultured bacterium contig00009]